MDSRQPRPLNAAYTSPSEQETDDYKLASQSMDDDEDYGSGYQPPSGPSKPKRRRKFMILLGLVLLLALGTAGYEFFKHHHVAPTAPIKTSTSSTSSAQPTPQATTESSATAHYVSNGKDLNLEFDYPSNWTVAPSSGNNASDQAITVNSPSTTVTAADGTSVTGKVTVNIRPGSATISELAAGTATAAQISAQFAYKSPTANQHQYPYLAFIHFASSSATASTQSASTTGAFEEVMITGIMQFNKGDAVSAASLSQLDPIISASFYRCSTTACGGQGAGHLSITGDTWQNGPLFQQVQALFGSLKLH